MVQLKYFGDDRDFFKYDLITHIFRSTDIINYAFIPMLTHHRQSNEGNKAPVHHSARSEELFRFIDLCPNKSLNHWEAWLDDFVESYKTIEPVDEIFFSDENREKYWEKFLPVATIEQALVFVDPDTGMETGRDSYLRKAGRDKYLLNKELKHLIGALADSSCLMIYQHLQRNKKKHNSDVEKKLSQVLTVTPSVYAGAYREDDLVFICITKNAKVFNLVNSALTKYHEKIAHKYGAIYSFSSGAQKEEAENIEFCTVEEIITSSDNEIEPSEIPPEDNPAQNFVNQLVNEDITHPYKVPIDSNNDKLNIDELIEQLDLDDMRQALAVPMRMRMKDSPLTLAKFIIKFTRYNGELGKEIRRKSGLQYEFVEKWALALTDSELETIIRDNIEISPVLFVEEMLSPFINRHNKKLLKRWLLESGFSRYKKSNPILSWVGVVFSAAMAMGSYWFLDHGQVFIALCFIPLAIAGFVPSEADRSEYKEMCTEAIKKAVNSRGVDIEDMIIPDVRTLPDVE